MLRILKYDVLSTYKKMIWFYLGIVLLSLITKYFWSESFSAIFNNDNFYVGTIFQGVSLGVYGFLAFLAMFTTTVIMSTWYANNMFGNEGYFVNSIPINPWVKVASKVITALLWNTIIVVVLALSLLIFMSGTEQLTEILGIFDELADNGIRSLHMGWAVVKTCIFAALNNTVFTCLLYACVSMGQLVNEGRNAVIFFSFIGLGLAVIILTAVMAIILGVLNIGELSSMEAMFSLWQWIMIKMSLICILLCGVLYTLSGYLVSNRLNLE